MSKKVIGIISTKNTEYDRPFNNYIKLVDTYANMIYEVGGLPILVSFPNQKVNNDIMALCDAFLFTGGPSIDEYQIKSVEYAIKNNKPILAICNGMQTLVGYEWFIKSKNNKYKTKYEKNYLIKCSNHNKVDPFYLSKISEAKHIIKINKDSVLYNAYKEDNISVVSIHNYCINEEVLKDSMFKVSACSDDGIVEAIEFSSDKNIIIGVQYHPELEKEHICLFKYFISKIDKI